MEYLHKTVLLHEAVDLLDIKPDGIYIDCTVGGAGHSREIAKRLTTGKLISLDKDPDAVETATQRLKDFECARVYDCDFSNFDTVLDKLGIDKADGFLLDLGVSSFQLDTAQRGFSFHKSAPLDMRMSKKGITAADVVNTYSESELIRILREYADEKFAPRIARRIVEYRTNKRIEMTDELAQIVSDAYPAAARRGGHPARQTFQAIRIEVNGELDCLSTFLDKALDRLNVGGTISIITFHSLEDRMVKQRFKEWCTGCTCPPDFPVCVCGKTPRAKLSCRKPIVPDDQQIDDNYRVRSSKLRGVIKL